MPPIHLFLAPLVLVGLTGPANLGAIREPAAGWIPDLRDFPKAIDTRS